MKTFLAAVAFAALVVSPASAQVQVLRCTTDNMAKLMLSMGNVDSPAKFEEAREMSLANTDMSNGNMRSACMHYMRAQRISDMSAYPTSPMETGQPMSPTYPTAAVRPAYPMSAGYAVSPVYPMGAGYTVRQAYPTGAGSPVSPAYRTGTGSPMSPPPASGY